MIHSEFVFPTKQELIFRVVSPRKRVLLNGLLSVAILALSCAPGFAQLTRAPNQTAPGQTQLGTGNPQSPSNAGQRVSPPAPPMTNGQQVSGAAKVSPAMSALSLDQAIALAIENNLATLLAKERRNEARGIEKQSLSELLPNLSGAAFQASITENLAALGFTPGSFPGITSTFIGPFKNFDARVRLQQTIFSLSALRNVQAGRAGVRVAELEESVAREQVAAATGLAYLETMRADLSVSAAQANVTLAETLLKLARDQRDAGIATGVDVTRAETRQAQEQVRLSQAQSDSVEARLQLQRIVGLPLGSSFTLTDPLRFAVETLPAVETAVATAEDNRNEVRVAQAEVAVNDYQKRAARAEQLPSLEFLGDYGKPRSASRGNECENPRGEPEKAAPGQHTGCDQCFSTASQKMPPSWRSGKDARTSHGTTAAVRPLDSIDEDGAVGEHIGYTIMNTLPEYLDGRLNLSGSESLIDQTIRESRGRAVFLPESRIDFGGSQSAFAIRDITDQMQAIGLELNEMRVMGGGRVGRT